MKNDVLFKGSDGKEVSYEDLLRKIYENAEAKQVHLLTTVDTLKPMITSIQDAIMLLPHLAVLQSISVKNDEQLVKLAAIVTRLNKKGANDDVDVDAYGLTAELRKELMDQAKELKKPGSAKSDL